MEKSKKEGFNLHSIYVKILALIIISVVAFFVLNIAYIIPRAKATIQKINENNMQDLATLCSEIVEQEIAAKGLEGVDYEVLKPIFEGRGLNGIDSSSIYVVDQDGIFLYHKKEEKIGTEVFNEDVQNLLAQIPTGSYVPSGIIHYVDENGVAKYSSYQVIEFAWQMSQRLWQRLTRLEILEFSYHV